MKAIFSLNERLNKSKLYFENKSKQKRNFEHTHFACDYFKLIKQKSFSSEVINRKLKSCVFYFFFSYTFLLRSW